MTARSFHTQGVLPCVVKDTMGAGDSYIAGFMMEYLRERTSRPAWPPARPAAAVTLGYVGAW
ncbi:MAG: PfkB family carbohydrate kinase [Oscillospiraceae bacterium]